MTRFKKRLLIFLSIVIIALYWFLWHIANIANGYTAKYLCSQTFNSKLDPIQVFENHIKPMHPLFSGVVPEVDENNKKVTAKYFGWLRPRTALWREGCGCILLVDKTESKIREQNDWSQAHKINQTDLHKMLWPEGNLVNRDSLKAQINWGAIDQILDHAIEESERDPAKRDNTLALVVAWNGHIIGERYAEVVDEHTSLLGWSATKSITSSLIGVMVKDHGLDIHQPIGLSAWKDDVRREITIDHLLRMESGLDFEENYTPFADATEMLYACSDMGAFAATHKAKANPDQRWCYSSGSSNIIAGVMFAHLATDAKKLHRLAYDEFLSKLGITTAVFEHDESGAFVGSSYLSMSARDWLRVCMLYMQDGIWNGERILPEGWVKYSLTPTPHSTDACYGAHIWLNASADSGKRNLPKLPADTFMFKGFQGQWVVGIPSKGIMLARFGVTHREDGWSPEKVLSEVINVLNGNQ